MLLGLTECYLGWTSGVIRMFHQKGGRMRADIAWFKWAPQWRETACLPAAVEVRVSGLHSAPSSSFIPPQRLFSGETISKLFCSAASTAVQLFVCWGEGSWAGGETAGNSHLHNCSLSILERLPRQRYTILSTTRMCNYCALFNLYAAPSAASSLLLLSDSRRRSAVFVVFFCLECLQQRSYLRWRSTERGSFWGVSERASRRSRITTTFFSCEEIQTQLRMKSHTSSSPH